MNAVVCVIQCLLDSMSQMDLIDRWQEKIKTKNNRMNDTEQKQKRSDELKREENIER